jgi:hypothetical protein
LSPALIEARKPSQGDGVLAASYDPPHRFGEKGRENGLQRQQQRP